MPIATKPADQVVSKYTNRASVAQPEYQAGIQGAGNSYETNAVAANASYVAAVNAAAAAGRYAAGVRDKGARKWSVNSLSKGPGRFVEGVRLGAGEYSTQVAKVLATIQGVTIPPRGPTGSAGNYQRTQPIGEALRRAFGKVK